MAKKNNKKKKTPKVYKVSKRRVMTDPKFERTRENMSEFGSACKANKALRLAFALAMNNKDDRYVSGRLTKRMYKVLYSDFVNDRGKRRVSQGILAILEGFNFNRDTSLQNVLFAPYTIELDANYKYVTITFPVFSPVAMVEGPEGATSCALTGVAASVNLEQPQPPATQVDTPMLSFSYQESLQLQLPVEDHQPGNTIFVGLGIEFFKDFRGSPEPADKTRNALAVVKVFEGENISKKG